MRLFSFMTRIIDQNPGENEFHQAFQEVAETIIPLLRISRITRKLKSWTVREMGA
ncbi:MULTISPECIES: hypothetical protein [Dyadobacter]|uniref:Uncharacterized protein n=2 Tax=Dyadobacter TaxID=120831 RepID=A0A9X1P9V4_9BACT|nr:MULTISPECIES: hypothetical protein [Dyadobacter]MCF0040349.1 hypothetical protein [Dyadobacter fanqingshengii]MCF2494829.1 hypothetical protein [Dyadobacter chenhuakuii]MCF2519092.1 hypothetical protein [Dyadobacter sp. CY351]USJ31851.1 hypothetical protein NFI80_03750 [Dyadobacter chenhuakuii]USJ37908.1 hypothetical protein NFI81_08995 [Dyadobacter fanqingshengii]